MLIYRYTRKVHLPPKPSQTVRGYKGTIVRNIRSKIGKYTRKVHLMTRTLLQGSLNHIEPHISDTTYFASET